MDFSDRFVDFEGAFNVRDLGGLPTPTGEVRRQKVYRADSPQWLTDADRSRVIELGVTHVIDLRTGDEANEGTWAVGPAMQRTLHEVIDPQKMIGATPDGVPVELDDEAFARRYLERLHDGGAEFVAAARVLTHGIDEGVIFHCSAGKDRTGLLAAFVLEALGVDRGLIVADYAASHEPMQRKIAHHMANSPDGRERMARVPQKLLESPAVVMERTLALADDKFGGIVACFQHHGFTDAELDRLRSALLI